MKDTYILAIESSCDETAVAIIKNAKEIVANVVATQIDVHKDFGRCDSGGCQSYSCGKYFMDY